MPFKDHTLSGRQSPSYAIVEFARPPVREVFNRQAPPPVTQQQLIWQDVAKTQAKARTAAVPNTVNLSQLLVICLDSHLDFLRLMAGETENPK